MSEHQATSPTCRDQFRQLSAGDIARRLAAPLPLEPQYERPHGPTPTVSRPAAVLLPLFREDGEWHLLFIRRAENALDRHSGQVAFPGGRLEPNDPHPAGAALREAQEEIGLDVQRVELLGLLPPYDTVSGYRVTPVVGRIPWPAALRPDPTEVARIFSFPLRWLVNPANHEVRPWPDPPHPASRPVVFFRLRDGERLWGVSARITLNFLTALAHRVPAQSTSTYGV